MSESQRMLFSDEENAAELIIIEAADQQERRACRPRRWVVCTTVAVLALAACAVAGAAGSTSSATPEALVAADFRGFMSAVTVMKGVNGSEMIKYPVIFRDFEGNDAGKGITMFEETCSKSDQMVEAELGADGKPVWKGVAGEGGITTRKQFDVLWNTDAQINKEIVGDLEFIRSADGDFRHDSPEFFPLDSEAGVHNYYFSMELHTTFTYQGGEKFNFRGDDDVYLFINKKLVVNLGGCHRPMTAEVDMDQLGLTTGNNYPFDFFFAERRCCGSSLRIETTLKLDDPVPIGEAYKCCVTHIFTKSWSWICFPDKKLFWCADKPQVAVNPPLLLFRTLGNSNCCSLCVIWKHMLPRSSQKGCDGLHKWALSCCFRCPPP